MLVSEVSRKRRLRNILLNVYGLTTLVINHEGLYSQHFTNIIER